MNLVMTYYVYEVDGEVRCKFKIWDCDQNSKNTICLLWVKLFHSIYASNSSFTYVFGSKMFDYF